MVFPTNTAIDTELLVDFDGNPIGGLKSGWFVQLRGRPQSGTTTFCMNLVHSFSMAVEGRNDPNNYNVLWIDGDCSLYDGVFSSAAGVSVAALRIGANHHKTIMDVMLQLGPLADMVIIDKACSLDAPKTFVNLCASAAHAGVLVLAVEGVWYSHQHRVEYVGGDDQYREQATLAIDINLGTADVAYSKVSQYPKRVRYEYHPEICKALPPAYQIPSGGGGLPGP